MSLIAQAAENIPILHSVTDETIARMAEEYAGLTCRGTGDADGLAKVSAARKECTRARHAVEATRKAMKARVLEEGKQIDGDAKRLAALIEPIEKRLAEQEDSVKLELDRIANAKKEEEIKGRMARLASIGSDLPEAVVRLLNGSQFEVEFQKADIAARGKREAAEQLAKQQEELSRLRAADEERRQADAVRIKAESDRLTTERAKLDQQRAEQQRAQQAIDEAARKAELARVAETTRIETEERIKRQKEKRDADSITEAIATAAARGDTEKIKAIGQELRNFQLPPVKGIVAIEVMSQVRDGLEWCAKLCEGFNG